MKKLIFLLLLLIPSLVLGQNNSPGELTIGHLPTNNNSDGTKNIALASGARWEAFSFVLTESKTLNSIRWFIDAKTGTIASGDARLDIYSDTANVPNVSLANSTTTSGSMTAKTWVSQTGYSLALTAGTRYWVVVRNVNGTPLSNNFDIRYSNGILPAGWTQSPATDMAFRWTESVTGVPNWGNDGGEGVFPFRLDFSDSTYFGFPIPEKVRALEGVVGQRVYSAREFGTILTTPANFSAKVKCLSFQIMVNGSPTGSLRYRIYQGTSLMSGATTNSYVGSVPSAGGVLPLCFPTAITLAASTSYRFVVSETTQSDTSTNGYSVTSYKNIDSNANSQILKPWGSTSGATYFDGSSWADNTTQYVPFNMHLWYGNEFVAGGAGVSNLGKFNGGFQ